jgi:hypothetical protein
MTLGSELCVLAECASAQHVFRCTRNSQFTVGEVNPLPARENLLTVLVVLCSASARSGVNRTAVNVQSCVQLAAENGATAEVQWYCSKRSVTITQDELFTWIGPIQWGFILSLYQVSAVVCVNTPKCMCTPTPHIDNAYAADKSKITLLMIKFAIAWCHCGCYVCLSQWYARHHCNLCTTCSICTTTELYITVQCSEPMVFPPPRMETSAYGQVANAANIIC